VQVPAVPFGDQGASLRQGTWASGISRVGPLRPRAPVGTTPRASRTPFAGGDHRDAPRAPSEVMPRLAPDGRVLPREIAPPAPAAVDPDDGNLVPPLLPPLEPERDGPIEPEDAITGAPDLPTFSPSSSGLPELEPVTEGDVPADEPAPKTDVDDGNAVPPPAPLDLPSLLPDAEGDVMPPPADPTASDPVPLPRAPSETEGLPWSQPLDPDEIDARRRAEASLFVPPRRTPPPADPNWASTITQPKPSGWQRRRDAPVPPPRARRVVHESGSPDLPPPAWADTNWRPPVARPAPVRPRVPAPGRAAWSTPYEGRPAPAPRGVRPTAPPSAPRPVRPAPQPPRRPKVVPPPYRPLGEGSRALPPPPNPPVRSGR